MTAFGKLLIFLNLLFSVITGALIVVVFTTRANWKSAYDDAKLKANQANTAYLAERAAHENDLKQKDSGSTSLAAEVVSLKQSLAATQVELDAANRKYEGEAKRYTDSQREFAKNQEELKQIRDERTNLTIQQQELRDKLIKVQRERDDEHKIAVLADLNAKNLVQKNMNLLRQFEELTLKYRELEQSGLGGLGGGGTGDAPSILNPPPKAAPPNVRGSVVGVGKEGTSLAQISIGSDSGLSPGNVLTVYKGSEYKGDLTITLVDPKNAVGKFNPARRSVKIEVNDSVITSFSGTSN